MGLSRRNAFVLYALCLFITIAGIAVMPLVNIAISILVTVGIAFSIVYYVLCNCNSSIPPTNKEPKQAKDTKSNLSVQNHTNTDSPLIEDQMNTTKKPKRARLYYLDNIKTFLTVIVVIHHITGGFLGNGWIYCIAKYYNPFVPFGSTIMFVNQSYFM
eukprot:192044_1